MIRFLRREDGLVTLEFALVAPLLAVLLAGMLSFGWIYGISSSLQRLSADAARASLVGANQSERLALAAAAVSTGVASFPLVRPAKLTAQVAAVTAPMAGVRVTLTYDMTGSQVSGMTRLWGWTGTSITRGAYVAW